MPDGAGPHGSHGRTGFPVPHEVMTLALARKYRPKTFTEVVGQEHVVRALTHALEQNRLHHAYLLTGTRGVGKTTLARIIAKALNCETGVTATPCGVCGSCQEIDRGRFIDLIELDAASNTQVDNMRELLENALYAPTAGRFKVYIIDEVHMLSRNAFNAMLKTLEEPPAHVKFILATTDPQKIPVTVLSRCLQFSLKQMTPALIRGQLEKVLGEEGTGFEVPALALIARAAHGSMRDSLSLLDQAIVHGGGTVAEAAVRDMLGVIDTSYLYVLLERLAARDGAGLMEQADAIDTRGLSFDTALQDLASLLHRVALAQVLPDSIADDDPERARLMALAEALSPEDVQIHYQIALRGRADLSLAPDDYAGFTMTLVRMLAFVPDADSAPTPPTPARAPAASAAPTSRAVPQRAAPSAASVPAAGPAAARAALANPAPIARSTATSKSRAPEPEPEPRAASLPPADPAALAALDRASWPLTVAQLGLGGMARMLAQHCEFVSVDDGKLTLAVPPGHRHLLEVAYREKFKAALEDRFGRLVVEFTVGAAGDSTLAAHETREREARERSAVEAIDSDPFVREVREHLDARLVEGSVRPLP